MATAPRRYARLLLGVVAIASIGVAISAQAEVPYTVAWSRQFQGSANYKINSVSADSSGSAYITGERTEPGVQSALVSKFDGTGNLLWSQQIGGPVSTYGTSIAVGGAGSTFVGGETYGSLDGPNAGLQDAFLSKLDSLGNVVWTRQFGTSGTDFCRSVAVDAIGNSYIAGSSANNATSILDGYIKKYDPQGNQLWSRVISTPSDDEGNAVAVDAIGDVYVAGTTFGNLVQPKIGLYDAFLSKYDSSGTLIWSRQFGTTGTDTTTDIALDAAGNLYVSGNTDGHFNGGSGPTPSAFLSRFDTSGNSIWNRQLRSNEDDFVRGTEVAADAVGNVFVSGQAFGSPNPNFLDAIVGKFDSLGNLVWSMHLGTAKQDYSTDIAVDGLGGVYTTGWSPALVNQGTDIAPYVGVLTKLVPEPSSAELLLTATIIFVGLACGQNAARWARVAFWNCPPHRSN